MSELLSSPVGPYADADQKRVSIAKRFLGLMCLLVLGAILNAGLSPFERPVNGVKWMKSQNGLQFGDYGTIVSSGMFRIEPWEDQVSLEIWLKAALESDSNTLLSFSSSEAPVQFSLAQEQTHLVVTQRGGGKMASIIVEDVFKHTHGAFITLTSDTLGSIVYLDGALAGRFPGFRIAKSFTGQLVIGTSPVAADSWPGQLLGLAIYHQALDSMDVLRHCETWTRQSHLMLGEARPVALYYFDERAGNEVHNAAGAGLPLLIPERFSLRRQPFLEPFWSEYKPTGSYWLDMLINVAGFVPLGFFTCAYWSVGRPVKRAILASTVLGLCVSLTVEVLQAYLPTRHSGTTDLFTNTLGSYLGAVSASLVLNFLRRQEWCCSYLFTKP